MEKEAEEYGMSADAKLKAFAKILDSNREVSVQEIAVRASGYGMCVASRVTKFINTSKPEHRDGLLKANLDLLEDGENPFFNSIVDYYQARDETLEDLSIAEFVSEYDLVTRSGNKVEEKNEAEAEDDDSSSAHSSK